MLTICFEQKKYQIPFFLCETENHESKSEKIINHDFGVFAGELAGYIEGWDYSPLGSAMGAICVFN